MEVDDIQQTISRPDQRSLGLILATAAYTMWGFSNIFTRIAVRFASPEVLLATRFFVALLMAHLLILAGKAKISFQGKKVGDLLLLGMLQPVLYFYFESYGIFYTNAALAGAMMAMNPIVALIMAVVLLKEKPSVKQKVFIWFPIVGVMIVTISTHTISAVRPAGVVLLMAAACCGGFAKIINRKISSEFTAFERTYIMIVMGFVAFTFMALVKNLGNFDSLFLPFREPGFLVSAFMLGTFCSFASFLCLNFAATALPVTQIAAFPSLSTVVSIAAGVLILREPFTLTACFGAILIVAGVWNMTR